MFSGIVETTGIIKDIISDGQNKKFVIESSISKDAYIDQSISHNGVCLTVVSKTNETHTVTAVHETLIKSNLDSWQKHGEVNLERSLLANSRMDGHFVQGHVDTYVICKEMSEAEGSWYFKFNLPDEFSKLVVSKGSICINGVSLTIADIDCTSFTVAIIPFTHQLTNFRILKVGDKVNIEFDILGKYIISYLEKFHANF